MEKKNLAVTVLHVIPLLLILSTELPGDQWNKERGTWVAQSVKCLTLAQVTISGPGDAVLEWR